MIGCVGAGDLHLAVGRRPAAAERLIKACRRLEMREPHLLQRVLVLEKGGFNRRERHDVDRALAQAGLRGNHRALRRRHRVLL